MKSKISVTMEKGKRDNMKWNDQTVMKGDKDHLLALKKKKWSKQREVIG